MEPHRKIEHNRKTTHRLVGDLIYKNVYPKQQQK